MFGSGIHEIEITLLLLIAMVALLALLAQRLRVPYPIVLLLGGLALSFLPWVPHISLDPSFVFLVVLPPLLFASTQSIGWSDLRSNLAPILTLGLGVVAFTVVGISVFMHFFVQGFDWRTGAALGAVVSTTDIIAVAAIAKRIGLPERILQVIEGESLINDAMGLLALQFASALVVSGVIPTVWEGLGRFFWLVVCGIAAGILVGVLIAQIERRMRSTALQLMVSVATPYLAYLLAESVHGSGVLAAVACGLYLGRLRSQGLSSRGRIESNAVWGTLDFSLNGLVFILIGLQLPSILEGLRGQNWAYKIGISLLVCALVIVLRFLWIFATARVPMLLGKYLFRRSMERVPAPILTVVGWSGMRGVLTLAAALSLPAFTDSGQPFPERQSIILYAYAVILVTLVGQGLSLPVLIRRLKVFESPAAQQEVRAARVAMIDAGLHRLAELREQSGSGLIRDEAYAVVESLYHERLRALEPQNASSLTSEQEDQRRTQTVQQISYQVREAERSELLRIYNDGKIQYTTLRRFERELDLLDMYANKG